MKLICAKTIRSLPISEKIVKIANETRPSVIVF
jgi:hypothetical protein